MNGKIIMIAMLGVAAIAGAFLWYSMERMYYVSVTGVTEVTAYGDKFPVTDYQGIDADTSPLKMRACFKVEWDYIPTEEFKDAATPLIAPSFFECFDAGQITADLEAGAASAILADENTPYGFNTFIAQYPDGRAYMWRQINACGDAWFSGNDLPKGCPEPKSEIIEIEDDVKVIQDSKLSVPARVAPRAAAMLLPANVVIRLLPHIGSKVEPIAIHGLSAVAVEDNPLTFHGCFKTRMSFGVLTETYKTHETPEPVASSLDCFDTDKLQADLNIGNALAFVGERNIYPGVERVIAVYEDGRAFAWHQKTRSE